MYSNFKMAEDSEDRSSSKSFFFISRSSDFLRFQLYFWLFFFFCLWGLSSAFWGNGTIALGMSLFMMPSYYFISQSLRILYSKLQVKGVFICFTSMGVLSRFGIGHPKHPYHGEVFTLDEIQQVVSEYGVPIGGESSDYSAYHKDDLELYIEAQLWSDPCITPPAECSREQRL